MIEMHKIYPCTHILRITPDLNTDPNNYVAITKSPPTFGNADDKSLFLHTFRTVLPLCDVAQLKKALTLIRL